MIDRVEKQAPLIRPVTVNGCASDVGPLGNSRRSYLLRTAFEQHILGRRKNNLADPSSSWILSIGRGISVHNDAPKRSTQTGSPVDGIDPKRSRTSNFHNSTFFR